MCSSKTEILLLLFQLHYIIYYSCCIIIITASIFLAHASVSHLYSNLLRQQIDTQVDAAVKNNHDYQIINYIIVLRNAGKS